MTLLSPVKLPSGNRHVYVVRYIQMLKINYNAPGYVALAPWIPGKQQPFCARCQIREVSHVSILSKMQAMDNKCDKYTYFASGHT
jgi:hypothetical protein